MTSVRPFSHTSSSSTPIERPGSLLRFNSARVSPEKVDDNREDRSEARPTSPVDIHVGYGLFQPSDSPAHSPLIANTVQPAVCKKDDNHKNRLVKISEYCTPENTPFEPITPNRSSKKLHRYILVTSRTICSLTLFSIVSIGIVLIGFGAALAHRQSQLDYRCPLISYCPRNTSYTLLCNITSEYCGCYDTNDELLGCMKQRNLQCNISTYQCQCLDHYYFHENSCIPMLTYGETCSMGNDTCDYLLNLKCLTGSICTCNTNTTFWNGEYCEGYRSVNSPCDPYKNISGCSMTFSCDNSTATCQCPSSAYYDGAVCLAYSSYLEPCYDTSSCLPGTYLVCSWGLCQCDDVYFYWSPTNLTCMYPKHVQYNSSCDYQTSCESDFGLRCIGGHCLCEANSYWTPGNYCDFQSMYNEQCLTAPCMNNTGLICSSNTSTCTCSKYYYWDGYVCQYERSYQSYCLSDTWCRTDLGMHCRNFTCTCSLCATCFWDGVRCRDCPTSWQIVTSSGPIKPRIYCYLKVDSYVNWNESAVNCPTLATSFFGGSSHLIYIDDAQELKDVSVFATNSYYDILIGHTNSFNNSQWFLANGTVSPALTWCSGVATTFSSTRCTRLLIGSICATDISCYGWTSRYICELD
ncbi:unnamed protein product [Adineta ricciae]|uniref:Uncharacterized protein n=1 Tax=Adineta ricciae TaxID=249248 RepID=A0A815GDH7_ADIRI|nr:unnamed protein product [Adineta ricciae]